MTNLTSQRGALCSHCKRGTLEPVTRASLSPVFGFLPEARNLMCGFCWATFSNKGQLVKLHGSPFLRVAR